MTDSEKMDLILAEILNMKRDMQGIKNELQSARDEVQSTRDEVQSARDEVRSARNEVQSARDEMQEIRKDTGALKRQIMKSTAELKAMDDIIFDEVERVHGILEKHMLDITVHTA